MKIKIFLTFSFLFFVGSVTGWILELLFRRFVSSANPERKWINPGFCVGPYVPLYGFGLCVLYLIAASASRISIPNQIVRQAVLILSMTLAMTAIEYIAGILSLKMLKVRLWDYSNQWGNLQGIICPKFSLAWGLLGSLYYILVHPYVQYAVDWLFEHLAFSFVIGLFYGVFLVDVVYSTKLVVKLKQFAEKNDVIVRYEHLKAEIRAIQDRQRKKHHFFFPLRTEWPLAEYLQSLRETFEQRIRKPRK